MIQLTPQNIQLHAAPRDKEDAIRQAGRVLVDARQHRRRLRRKHARPRAAGEHLPRQRHRHPARHGQRPRTDPQDGRVAWCSFPTAWNGTPARSCASSSASRRNRDEHLGILAALTDVLDDTATANRLAQTDDPADIIAGLTRRANRQPRAASRSTRRRASHRRGAAVRGAGLHARPATNFVDVANEFAVGDSRAVTARKSPTARRWLRC